jgi:hypothetical protein
LQFGGAAHREARAFAKTLSNTTTVYAARTRINGRQVTRHFDRKIDAESRCCVYRGQGVPVVAADHEYGG